MSDKPSFTVAESLWNKIQTTDASADPMGVIALYEELIPMLRFPRKRGKDLTADERLARRQRRREMKAQGLNPRTGKPYTQEELAKIAARQTPEAKAKASAAAKERMAKPEVKAKIQEAAAQRRAKQAADAARLKELEAMVANMMHGGQVPAEQQDNEEVNDAPVFGKHANRKGGKA